MASAVSWRISDAGVQIRWLNYKITLTRALNIEEVDIMGSGVYHGPKCHGVRDLAMEPYVLIGRKYPSKLRSDDTDDIA